MTTEEKYKLLCANLRQAKAVGAQTVERMHKHDRHLQFFLGLLDLATDMVTLIDALDKEESK